MAGANYMGGKRCVTSLTHDLARVLIAWTLTYILSCILTAALQLERNAARARVKDAAGNAQRAHFGKKRLEILRTSLSKRGNARSIQKQQEWTKLEHKHIIAVQYSRAFTSTAISTRRVL
ncbi:hypothetical protein C8Q74DRAFT_642602 [Fomes fomentarius]|nr:hypothetical protein C8Q74DRAFT_642602 [Fomes fomentarius]